MDASSQSARSIVVKTIITHTVTYFIMGLVASTILNYGQWFAQSELNQFMRPTTDPWVMAGPLFQPLRGLLFGIVFYLLRDAFFGRKRGWLLMWLTLMALGIFAVFGPTPGSIEGMVYTTLPLAVHLRGLPEVLLQSLLLSLITFYWVTQPKARWLGWLMGILFIIVLVLPILGLLVGTP